MNNKKKIRLQLITTLHILKTMRSLKLKFMIPKSRRTTP